MDKVKPVRIKEGPHKGLWTIAEPSGQVVLGLGGLVDATPSRKTAQKWADAENNNRRKVLTFNPETGMFERKGS